MTNYLIALGVVLLVLAFAAWAFLPAKYLPANRARHLRVRLHLRLHPGKGFATVFALHLRWGQVTIRDGTVHVRFGDHDVPVPEPLGAVLAELTRNGRTRTATGAPPTTPWLFPGGLPGQPITPCRLGGRLRALGIHATKFRRAALTGLAAQLPAAVLADLLGGW
ncbi:MAG TPA: hypothetical protein VNF47_00365 [Streptosporangiaceae bacterium]|nr:hypothetical protein [Streptosporangiaceae bacterium]